MNIGCSTLCSVGSPVATLGFIGFGAYSLCDFLRLNFGRSTLGFVGMCSMLYVRNKLVEAQNKCAARVSEENKGVEQALSTLGYLGGWVGVGALVYSNSSTISSQSLYTFTIKLR